MLCYPILRARLECSGWCAHAGGVNLDMEADAASGQPLSRATSGDMMGEDEDMPSGLLSSWLLI